MKYIRELRMGPPKSGKTVAVVGTYPKPMLVFQFDTDGIDVIPSNPPTKPDANRIALDITYKDITFIDAKDFPVWCAKQTVESISKVTLVNFASTVKREMSDTFTPIADNNPYNLFHRSVNALVRMPVLPWKTFVLDSTTALIDSLRSFITATNPTWNTDARKWSPAAGSKVLQHISVMNSLQMHCVYIAHSHVDKNETTGEVTERPLGPGGFASQCGGLVSQFIYATNETGKLEVYTRPKGNVKSIGCRWPSDLPAICGADFKSIYGKEL